MAILAGKLRTTADDQDQPIDRDHRLVPEPGQDQDQDHDQDRSARADQPTIGQRLACAEAQVADADFVAALQTLTELAAAELPSSSSGDFQRFILLLARVLRALSRYDAARDVLQLARHSTLTASRAAAEEAEIAWIQHDYDRGAEAATYALRANLANRKAEIALRRCRQPITPSLADAPTGGVGHVAFYVSEGGNFGDVALPVSVRESIEHVAGQTDWLPIHAHQVFDEARLELVNGQRSLIIGGGGLFLPDTSPNGNSGWQWNVPAELLNRIEVPISVFAVGFNLFTGQRFRGDLFTRNLLALTERAQLIGLRNHGSMAAVRAMLPERLHERVRFVPCPTTITEHIHPGLPPARSGTGVVLLNAAFDRAERRFGDGYAAFLEQIHRFAQRVRAAGAELRLAAHLPADEKLADDLDSSYGVRLPIDPLYDRTLDQGYAIYRAASVVVGMRGHATMIPFGLGTPVLSIVSHPKLRFFCEDIGRPDWAFDADDPRLGSLLADRVIDILGTEDAYRADIARLQLGLKEHIDAAARDAAVLPGPQDVSRASAGSPPGVAVRRPTAG
ncbi:polysaccharide pyruvyl transferase family protein [Microlunatus elymi]|nr:polysaccharide pyruvyl transferase family protein [Microlunatus elymi]